MNYYLSKSCYDYGISDNFLIYLVYEAAEKLAYILIIYLNCPYVALIYSNCNCILNT